MLRGLKYLGLFSFFMVAPKRQKFRLQVFTDSRLVLTLVIIRYNKQVYHTIAALKRYFIPKPILPTGTLVA